MKTGTTMTKTLKYAKVGQCYLLVLGQDPPTDHDWEDYLDFLDKSLTLRDHPRLLVSTSGGAPSAAQRARLQAVTKPYSANAKIAVLTASKVARGAVTALSWFTTGYAAFHPDATEESMQFLSISGVEGMKVKNELRLMQRDIGALVK